MPKRWKNLDRLTVAGKRVLTRVDYNVPMLDGKVTDATRIERTLPTLATIHAKGGIPVLLSHLGRPESPNDMRFSLSPLVPVIERLTGKPVMFSSDTIGTAARSVLENVQANTIVLLENLRFNAGEEANDPGFAASLAALGDVYCNDAFSASHRAHASIDKLARMLPACAGQLMEAELEALHAALDQPQRPVLAIIGGAKISTKIKLIFNLLDKTDYLCVGGAMANTFHLANGMPIGTSLVESDMVETAKAILSKAAHSACELVLPKDSLVADKLASSIKCEVVAVSDCPANLKILDIGPQSSARINTLMQHCRTLIWNGPTGAFEYPPFDSSTRTIARNATALTREGELLSFAGGGDTIAALNWVGLLDEVTYASTAGGAFLEWMEGKELPGISALME